MFCTPEYLFGTPSTSGCIGTARQFNLLLEKKECVSVVTIDEAHKIFDIFNEIKQLANSCIIASIIDCRINC